MSGIMLQRPPRDDADGAGDVYTDPESGKRYHLRGSEDAEQVDWLSRDLKHEWRYNRSTKSWHHLGRNGIWGVAHDGAIRDHVIHLTMERLRGIEYLTQIDNKNRDMARKVVRRLLEKNRIESALAVLSWRDDYSTDGSDWDRDPFLFGTASGIVDLRTNALVCHPDTAKGFSLADEAALLVSKSSGHKFKPDALCPKTDAFLLDIMSGDKTMVAFLWRWHGMSMFGHTDEQKFLILVGRGRNGKFVLTSTIRYAMGEYAGTPASSLYMRTRNGEAASNEARPDLIDLMGLRLAVMSEPPGGHFNEEMLKAHTGRDPIHARTLYVAKPVSFEPTHTIVFLTNELPEIDDVGASMQGRVLVADFLKSYMGTDANTGLPDELKAEAEGVQARLIREAGAYIREGLGKLPKRLLDVSAEFIADNDPLGEYLPARCVVEAGAKTKTKDLTSDYVEWCAREDGGNCDPADAKAFGRSLRQHGVRLDSGRRNYVNIRFKTATDLADTETL